MVPTTSRIPGAAAAIAALLCAAVLLAYSPAFDNSFVLWDDQLYVTENPLVADPTWRNLARLVRAVVALNWHPVTMSSLWVNAKIWGASSAGHFIAGNVAVHLLNTVLVFLLLRRLTAGNRLVAAAAALAFGLHPMHVESVAWVSGRKDVLFALFYLIALFCYETRQRSGRRVWLGAAWAAFALSCLSKAVAVSLPLTLLLVDVAAGRSLKNTRAWLEKSPFFVLALLVGGIAWNIQGGGDAGGWLTIAASRSALPPGEGYPLVQRLQFASYGYLRYLAEFLVPHSLCAYYPYPTAGELQGHQRWLFTAAPLLVAALWAGAITALRRTIVPLLCLALFTVTVAPVAQVITVGRALMADRYTYLPHLGPAIAAGFLADALVRRRLLSMRAAWCALVLVGAVWGALTFRQAAVWRNDDTLWGRVISLYPDAGVPRVVRGHVYGKTGRIDLAIRDFEHALGTGFENADLYEGLGNAYGSLGDPRRALPLFDRALALDPGSGSIRYNRGIARMALGDYPAAIDDFTASLSRVPPGNTAQILRMRGQARQEIGDAAGAAADLREAAIRGTPP